MGALLTIPSGLNLESLADGWQPDVGADLSFANFMNSSANLNRNLVEGGEIAAVTGTPVVTDEFAEVGQNDYIDTGIGSPAGSFTWIVVAKSTDDDTTGWLLSSRNAAADTGIWLYRASFAPGQLTAGAFFDVGGVPTADTLVGPTDAFVEGEPFCAALRYNASTGARRLDMLTIGEATSDVVADAMEVSSDTVLVGRSVDGVGAGGSGVAAAFLYDAELSDTQLAAQYAQIKAGMAVVGISV